MGRSGVRQAQRNKRPRKDTPRTHTHEQKRSEQKRSEQTGNSQTTGRQSGGRPKLPVVPMLSARASSRLLARPRQALSWLVALGVGLTALAFDLHQLGGVNVWFDEAFSYVFASQPLGLVWHAMWGPEPNMELYYAMLYGWLRLLHLFGLRPTEFWLRLPSALFAALATLAVFALGKRLGGWSAALLAALLFTLNPLQLYYAQQARSYSMEVFFTVAAWYALLVAIETPISPMRPGDRWGQLFAYRWWIVYALMVSLSAYAQLFTALTLAAQVVAFGLALLLPSALLGPWREQAQRVWRPFAWSLCAIGVACLPLFSATLHGGHNTWVGPATVGELGRFFLVSLSGGSWLYLLTLVALGALAVISGIDVPAWGMGNTASKWRKGMAGKRAQTQQTQRRTRRAATGRRNAFQPSRAGDGSPQLAPFAILALLCWLIAPIALSFALTSPIFNAHLFLDRYLVVVVPPLCLLAALGAGLAYRRALGALEGIRLFAERLGDHWLAWGLAAALGLLVLVVVTPQAQRFYASADTQGLHTGMPWIEQRYQPGDGIACYPDAWCALPLTYYLQAVAGPARLDPASPSDNLSLATLAAYGAKHRRVFLIISVFHPRSGVLPQLEALRRWADTHWKPLERFTSSHTDYQYIGAFLTTSITIVLYQTGAGAKTT